MFVFVILHYLSTEMTTECVNSILKTFNSDEMKIVIVDNASPNSSGIILKDKYKSNKACHVIINNKNIGFAQGNNIGYQYAKNNLNPDFIIIMNNDVLILDSMFLDKIKDIYIETPFSILGPDIISGKTLTHQNPIQYSLNDKKTIEIKIKNWEKRLRLFTYYYYRGLFGKKILKLILSKKSYNKVLDDHKENKINKTDFYKTPKLNNPVLHGACYIFSDKFINNEEFAFNPNTFLYLEEEILHTYCLNKKHSMIYNPNISVIHLEDIATDLAFKNNYKKDKMKLKYCLDSIKILYNLVEK